MSITTGTTIVTGQGQSKFKTSQMYRGWKFWILTRMQKSYRRTLWMYFIVISHGKASTDNEIGIHRPMFTLSEETGVIQYCCKSSILIVADSFSSQFYAFVWVSTAYKQRLSVEVARVMCQLQYCVDYTTAPVCVIIDGHTFLECSIQCCNNELSQHPFNTNSNHLVITLNTKTPGICLIRFSSPIKLLVMFQVLCSLAFQLFLVFRIFYSSAAY